MLSQSDLTAQRINRMICSSEADDLETLVDFLAQWKGQLEDMYRLGLTEAAAGLHDDLSNLAGELQHQADLLREDAQQ